MRIPTTARQGRNTLPPRPRTRPRVTRRRLGPNARFKASRLGQWLLPTTSISRLRPRSPTRSRFLRDAQTRRFGASSQGGCTGRKCSEKACELAGLCEYEIGQLPSERSIGRHYGLRPGGARGGPALCPWRDDSRTSFCMVDRRNQYETVGETGQREGIHIGTLPREAGSL